MGIAGVSLMDSTSQLSISNGGVFELGFRRRGDRWHGEIVDGWDCDGRGSGEVDDHVGDWLAEHARPMTDHRGV